MKAPTLPKHSPSPCFSLRSSARLGRCQRASNRSSNESGKKQEALGRATYSPPQHSPVPTSHRVSQARKNPEPDHQRANALLQRAEVANKETRQTKRAQQRTSMNTLTSGFPSRAWSQENDKILMRARTQGLNWQPIASQYFPDRTANACRKRHERLMEKLNSADSWNGVKQDQLSRAYYEVREQMWSLLGDRVGENWRSVESKCMETGLKALKAQCRNASRHGANVPRVSEDRSFNCESSNLNAHPDGEESFVDSAIGTDSHYSSQHPSYRIANDEEFHSKGREIAFDDPAVAMIEIRRKACVSAPQTPLQKSQLKDDADQWSGPDLGFMLDMSRNKPSVTEDSASITTTVGPDTETIHDAHQNQDTLGETELSLDRFSSDSPLEREVLQHEYADSPEKLSDTSFWSGDTRSSEDALAQDEAGLIDDRPHVLALFAKHEVVLNLMRSFYSIFDFDKLAGVKACAVTKSSPSHDRCASSNTQRASSSGNCKRARQTLNTREPQDPDDDENPNKRRRKSPKDEGDIDGNQLYACPFNKFDPHKYCVNARTGQMYRTCWRPGFQSIARLRQHLRRKHRAPIQCPRCWAVMQSVQELSHHANAEARCEQREPNCEGIDQDKMELIDSHWGARWDKIYEFIFPGAPIPSPFLEDVPTQAGQKNTPSLVGQSFHDFNEYSRVALPLLVEANLRAILNAEMLPVEERINTLIVDIVRRCQSTVAQNFEQITSTSNQSSDSNSAGAKEAARDVASSQVASITEQITPDMKTIEARRHYLEPTFACTEPDSATTTYPYSSELSQQSNSSYASSYGCCSCDCHLGIGSSQSSQGQEDCNICIGMHSQIPSESFDDFSALRDF